MEFIFENIYVPNQHSFIAREIELKKNTARVHSHKNYELNFIVSGSGKRIVGNNISGFEKNDLVLMSPNIPHCWEILNTEHQKPASCIVIHFYENLIISDYFNKPELEGIVKLLREAKTGIFFYGKKIEKIAPLLKKLTQQKGLKSYIGLLEIFELLLSIEDKEYLSKMPYAVSNFNKGLNQVNKVYEYVFKNIQEDIKLKDASALLNMAPGSFCRFFKKKTKMTFMEYVINIRIGLASKLLAETNKQISEIGYECGYSNLANFNCYFKKIIGKNPSEYRKEFR